MDNYRLQVALDEETVPEGALGALFPVPPTTADQEFVGMNFPPTWTTRKVSTEDARQSAVLASFAPQDLRSAVRMDIGLRAGPLIEAHFVPREGRNTAPGDDAVELFRSLQLDGVADERARLRRIVDRISEKFVYKHSTRRTDTPLTCDLLTGNCLDINSALMKLLRLAHVKHAYYIGYFVEEGQSAAGRHCWVSTVSQGRYENWDIAHHLKRDVQRVEAGLNPIAGLRFAMSSGWDPVFDLGAMKVEMHHLATPRWIFQDGSTEDCKVKATVSQVRQAEAVA